MYPPFDIQLTLQDLIALNPANLILIPVLSVTALVVNIPILGPLIMNVCRVVTGH